MEHDLEKKIGLLERIVVRLEAGEYSAAQAVSQCLLHSLPLTGAGLMKLADRLGTTSPEELREMAEHLREAAALLDSWAKMVKSAEGA